MHTQPIKKYWKKYGQQLRAVFFVKIHQIWCRAVVLFPPWSQLFLTSIILQVFDILFRRCDTDVALHNPRWGLGGDRAQERAGAARDRCPTDGDFDGEGTCGAHGGGRAGVSTIADRDVWCSCKDNSYTNGALCATLTLPPGAGMGEDFSRGKFGRFRPPPFWSGHADYNSAILQNTQFCTRSVCISLFLTRPE